MVTKCYLSSPMMTARFLTNLVGVFSEGPRIKNYVLETSKQRYCIVKIREEEEQSLVGLSFSCKDALKVCPAR